MSNPQYFYEQLLPNRHRICESNTQWVYRLRNSNQSFLDTLQNTHFYIREQQHVRKCYGKAGIFFPEDKHL